MPDALEHWQERLEAHFAELAATRSESGLPLFALEHGLDANELAEIASPLLSRMRHGLPASPHWLLWVVYAAERGYEFEGGEYWDLIQVHTGVWDNATRDRLRDWFRRFQRTYNGVVPSGRWANWFTIIAWPITHSILPKDLQWQLARTLYSTRHDLISLRDFSPSSIGKLLGANAWDTSSRFQAFLQQEELAGRIVLALLMHETVDDREPIYEPTLNRIVADLERVQSAREWLRETRRFVADRLKGASRQPLGRFPDRPSTSTYAPISQVAKLPSIRPSLMLRRSGPTVWTVIIEVSGFSDLVKLQPELRGYLRITRCKIGAGDSWLPMNWLLMGMRRRALKSWPGADRQLITFERPNPVLEHILSSEARLSEGPIWVCRVRGDGLATDLRGRVVRPNQTYVILSEGPLPNGQPMLTPCTVDCTGIHGGVLNVPETLTHEDMLWLNQLGVSVARTVRIWPAGLPARNWDGEGSSEWLTNEAPCFGVMNDHPVDAYGFQLDGDPEIQIAAGSVKLPIFVKVPPLSPGQHALRVRAIHANDPYPTIPAEGFIALSVREPDPWTPGRASHRGLVISVDPPEPTLDMFSESEVGVTVIGPEGHQITCEIELFNTQGQKVFSEPIGTFPLPVTAAAWSRKLSSFVADEKRTWAFAEAASGQLVITGDELGRFVLKIEREFRPLRWVCRNEQRVAHLRLIDDTGGNQEPQCTCYAFGHPSRPTAIQSDVILGGRQIAPPGGLYIADQGEFAEAIVISTHQIAKGFANLLVEPDLTDLAPEEVSAIEVLNLLHLWSSSRIVGPLGAMRRAHIVQRLANQLYSKLCGRRWAEAENALVRNPNSAAALQQLERAVGGPQGFAVVLRRDNEKMDEGTGAGSRWYAEVSRRYQVCDDPRRCEWSLRLASQPEQFLEGEELRNATSLAMGLVETNVLRGARLLAVLASIRDHGPKTTLPRWQW